MTRRFSFRTVAALTALASFTQLAATHPAAAQTAAASPPSPPSKQECVAAFESAQILKSVGKLTEAVAQAQVCAAKSCPKMTQIPCDGWAGEWQALIPSVTFAITDENGQPTTEFSLGIDGKPPISPAPAKLELAPGPHAFRVLRAGQPEQEASIVLVERDVRSVQVRFPLSKTESPLPPPPAPTTRPARKIPVATWVLGGVGVAGLGVFAGFGLAGKSSQDDLERTCSPRCSPDDGKSVKTKYLLADIGLGVGVLSLAAATYFAVRPAPTPQSISSAGPARPRMRADLLPLSGGAAAIASGEF